MGELLRVELDRLDHLAAQMDLLAGEAATLRVGPAAGPFVSGPGGIMSSVLEAAAISRELLDAALVPAVTERLEETADVMRQIVAEYRDREDEAVALLVNAYLASTGEWTDSEPVA